MASVGDCCNGVMCGLFSPLVVRLFFSLFYPSSPQGRLPLTPVDHHLTDVAHVSLSLSVSLSRSVSLFIMALYERFSPCKF